MSRKELREKLKRRLEQRGIRSSDLQGKSVRELTALLGLGAPAPAPAPAPARGLTSLKIISGGQTGADQGGLEAGAALGLETGGWVPKGWRTEHGSDPSLARFGLREHSARGYPPRTRLNATQSDGTFWFGNPHSPGGKLTLRTARGAGKPVFLVDWRSGWSFPREDIADFLAWLRKNHISVLNVAGNRESSQPGIQETTRTFLVQALR